MTITPGQAETFERCMAVGGVAVFGADTVYGLACEPDTEDAVARLYAIKGRRPDKPAAVLFFSLELALAGLPELGPRTVAALQGLMPGAVTVLLPNPAGRFPLACRAPDGDISTLGLRVPALGPATAALGAVRWPVLQSSANPSGGADARRLEDVPAAIRQEADLLLDAGELDGTASTVIDLRRFESDGAWEIVRQGAVARERVVAALDGLTT
ncbi:MAG TPA: Sua5/YciO/YrdC/YwlC family protein [Baekduia sp.]|uniref:L-threonylcarbamoyladenylate synthase n=1 Tax=Baekduia sp. TaxID=2600305 RepID=UPI002C53B5CD|nr:Sua5/YciO/YrdC/YwlC family protein [Baekduia sp.]HMJ32319.1 Sua5/YciO/YrdC/YwlC family protein [Baekduia sp.]